MATTLAALLLSAACGARADAGERIAFVSNRDGDSEIYMMNPDGSFATRLIGHDFPLAAWVVMPSTLAATRIVRRDDWGDRQPVWSPDGRRVAFASIRDGNWEIYAVNADGSGLTRLTNNDALDWQPVWSPDGRRVAFVSEQDGNEEIYAARADGSELTRLTNNEADDWQPVWSPDGRRIAFVSDRDGNDEIYAMNADGSEMTRLTHNPTGDWDPAWSPDGRRIAFASDRDEGERWFPPNSEIYAMNADGTDITRLTDNNRVARGPVWSPDGRRIAFSSSPGHAHASIHITNADGSTLRTFGIARGYSPVWSPDGRRIVFTDYPGDGDIIMGDTEIYAINADGSKWTQLTDNDHYDGSPSWRPAR